MIKEFLRVLQVGSLLAWISIFIYSFFVISSDKALNMILLTTVIIIVMGIVGTNILNIIKFFKSNNLEENDDSKIG